MNALGAVAPAMVGVAADMHRQLFLLAPDLLAVLSLEGELLALNPAGERLAALTADEVARRGIFSFVHPDYLSAAMEAMQRAVTLDKGVTEFECPLVSADGTCLWMSFSASVDLPGHAVYLSGRDISERRAAQEAEREHHARMATFRRMFEASPLGICFLGPDLHFLAVNRAACQIAGCSEEEMLQHSVLDFSKPDERAAARKAFDALGRGDVPVIAYEKIIMTASGAPLPVRITNSVLRGADGTDDGFVAFIEDISERRRTEHELVVQGQKLSENQVMLNEAQALAQVGSYSWDFPPSGPVTWSEQLYRLCARDPATFQPSFERYLESVHPDDRAIFQASVENAMRAGGSYAYECRVAVGSTYRWQQVSGRVELTDQGTPRRAYGVVRDVTDERHALAVERELSAIVASSDDAIVGLTLDGVVTSWNRGAERIYGYRDVEMIGHSAEVLMVGFDQPLGTFLTSIAAGARVSDLEVAARRSDGSVAAIALSAAPMVDRDGLVQGISTVARDITERKRQWEAAQEAFREAAQSAARLEQQGRDLARVNDMAELLQSCIDMDEARQLIAQAGRDLFPGLSGALFTLSASRDQLEREVAWGSALTDHPFAPEDCWALRRGRLYAVKRRSGALTCRHLPGRAKGDYICVPLMAGGDTLGLLHLRTSASRSDAPAPDMERVANLASMVAEHFSLALANFRLRETLRFQSIRDPLTGLFNRRYMEESMERELHRAERDHTCVGVIQLDLDHFKHFNDAYGHSAGDAVLRAFAACVKRVVRVEDIACRYGGEEFTLVMPGASSAVTAERAEALRVEVAQIATMSRGQSLGGVTISAGVAAFPADAVSVEELLHVADKALYEAKAGGRDRVVCASPPTGGE